MSRIVFLLEEYSMKVLLDELLPRLFPGLPFLCVPHEGKQDLERSIPRKLRAWREPGVHFCVIRDNDGADCRVLKQNLVALCQQGGRGDTLVRIACQELEAWYFGAPDALAEIYGLNEFRSILARERFRDPDAIVQPATALASLVPGFQKVSGARNLARVLLRENRSRSYRVFIAGIDRLSEQIRQPQGDN
jgi:hypothetical protein